MKNILFACIFASLSLACAATQSQTVESSNMAPPNKQATPAQETPTPSRPSMREIFEAAREPKEPTPKPIGIPTPIKDSDYVASKLNRSKMKNATLDRQPQQIIKSLMSDILIMYPERNSPGKVKISVEDRDLNQDGVLERIVASRFNTEEEVPSLRIFRFENNKWNCCIFMTEGSPDNELSEIEFLSKTDSSDFDLIKLIDEYGDKEVIKDTFYYQMQDGKYKLIECHKIEGNIEKVVACGN